MVFIPVGQEQSILLPGRMPLAAIFHASRNLLIMTFYKTTIFNG